jgi:Tfp pilus assembly protein PilZ
MKSPTRWRVTLYQPEAESVKWRFLLRFLGVESTPLCNEKELTQVLSCDQPGLIIFDRTLLGEAFSVIEPRCMQWMERNGGIALTGDSGPSPIAAPFLARVTDISDRDPFTINALLQRFVPTYSRRHPRLATRLPGLYERSTGNSQICEIMNLSTGGAFIRTTETLPLAGEELRVTVPLLGLHKEIELGVRVVCRVLPNEVNKFTQGVGVSFVAGENPPAFIELDNYVRYVLTHDEAFDLQVMPYSDRRTKRNMHEAKSTALRLKGREPSLLPDL